MFIGAVVTAGNTIFFIVPGHWGFSEGIHIIVLESLGFEGAVGLSLIIIKRIRKILFSGLGLILLLTTKDT